MVDLDRFKTSFPPRRRRSDEALYADLPRQEKVPPADKAPALPEDFPNNGGVEGFSFAPPSASPPPKDDK